MTRREPDHGLLGPGDPPPFTIVNPHGAAPAVLLCDHASNAVPAALGDLGLDEATRSRHIAWDIGAAEITRHLTESLGAPAVLSGYSRLVVDCNRSYDDPTAMRQISDGTVVPGNRGLDATARALRAGLEAMGLELFGDPAHRLANVTGVVIPDGVPGEPVRAALLQDFGIEIGTSFGPLHGRIWRIGTMGHVCREANVVRCLDALDAVLRRNGFQAAPGAGVAAAEAVYAETGR